MPNNLDVTNYRVICSRLGNLFQLYTVATETQQNAQENDNSVFCHKQCFASVECKGCESLCLRAQLEALIMSMGQKVSSSFEICLGVTGWYQTLVPGFWASLITCLQVSNHWGFPLCYHDNVPAVSILNLSVYALVTWKPMQVV